MADIAKFQQMNGCSACRHAAAEDPQGNSAASLGKSFWCPRFEKPVDAKDGATCPAWELAS